MRKPAVPAPYGKVPASYGDIMGTCTMTVPAFNSVSKVPDIMASNFVKCPWLGDILNPGDKNTRRPAVVAHHPSLIRYCFYDLVCHLLALVAVSAEFCENELVTHGKYWLRPGSLICCRISAHSQRSNAEACHLQNSEPVTKNYLEIPKWIKKSRKKIKKMVLD